MNIHFSPVSMLNRYELAVSVAGDVITLNGVPFDFSQLPNGAALPASAIDSEWFAGPVERIAGELRLTLRLPYWGEPSEAVAYPAPINAYADGPVELPQ